MPRLDSAGGGGGGVVTAINDATENELVTIGATTTELEAEADFLIGGGKFSMGTSLNPASHHFTINGFEAGRRFLFLNESDDVNNYNGLSIEAFNGEKIRISGNQTGSSTGNQYIEFANYQSVLFGAPNLGTFLEVKLNAGATANQVIIGKEYTSTTPLLVNTKISGDGFCLFVNEQDNEAGSTNETTGFRFGFGNSGGEHNYSDYDVARITVGKEQDYTDASESDSFMAFYTDVGGTATERMRIKSTTINLQNIPDALDDLVTGDVWANNGVLTIIG